MIWLGQPAQEPSWDHNGNWCWQKIPLNIFSNHWVYFSHILLYYAICQPVFIGSFCTGASLTIAMAKKGSAWDKYKDMCEGEIQMLTW